MHHTVTLETRGSLILSYEDGKTEGSIPTFTHVYMYSELTRYRGD